MRQDRRGSWYLLTGAVLGVAIGLVYSWVVSPVQYIDAPPYALRADYKNDYRALVAAAYLYNGDLVRAEDRLVQLKDDNMAQTLAIQAQQALTEGHPEGEVKALSLLAMALTKGVTPTISFDFPSSDGGKLTPTLVGTSSLMPAAPGNDSLDSSQPVSSINNPGSTPQDSMAELPAIIATQPTSQDTSFTLAETKLVCNPDQTLPLIQIILQDAAGQPIPGIEAVVTWESGEDHFYTGLKPELGLGYADFTMTPGVIYSLHLNSGGQPTGDLTAAQCMTDDGTYYWGSWLLTFTQP